MGMFSCISIDPRWLPGAPQWAIERALSGSFQSKDFDDLRDRCVGARGDIREMVWADGHWVPTGTIDRDMNEKICVYAGADDPPEDTAHITGPYHTRWYEVELTVKRGRVIQSHVVINRPFAAPLGLTTTTRWVP